MLVDVPGNTAEGDGEGRGGGVRGVSGGDSGPDLGVIMAVIFRLINIFEIVNALEYTVEESNYKPFNKLVY